MESMGETLDLSHPDPEIADALAAAAATERLLNEALLRLGPALLERVPHGQIWSAVETVGHLLDVEVEYGHRLRSILSQDTPCFSSFDEEALISHEHWRTRDLPNLLTAWSALRRIHLTLIARLDADTLARGGILPDTKHPMTARDLVLRIVIRDRFHLSQLGILEKRFLHPSI